MKKLTKKEVVDILKNKSKKTYKELSIITGYHEKSLIRLNKDIKENKVVLIHGNKNKKPHNYIDEQIKEEIVKEYLKGKYKNFNEYHRYSELKGMKLSYSFITKLLRKYMPKVTIVKKDKEEKYYFPIRRKMIKDNIVQYNNIRYKVINGKIDHHTEVELYFDEEKKEYFIILKNKKYKLKILKEVKSRKGLSKYY